MGLLLPFAFFLFAGVASPPPPPPDLSLWPALAKLYPPQGEEIASAANAAAARRACGEAAFEATAGVTRADVRAAAAYLAWLAEEPSPCVEDARMGEGHRETAHDMAEQGEDWGGNGANDELQLLRGSFRIASPANGMLFDLRDFKDGELDITIEVNSSIPPPQRSTPSRASHPAPPAPTLPNQKPPRTPLDPLSIVSPTAQLTTH